jgi:uncharacterized protein (DUF2252 family)
MKELKRKKPAGFIQAHPADGKLKITYASRSERYEMGKQLRKKCPRSSHATFSPPANRPSQLEMMKESEKGRVEKLLPMRHGRMAASPFTFYRGSALNMAIDLAKTPSTGVYVQACGDAHLCNFGGFATPERNIIFSINDLDETLPAPWEWDVKRLAASFVVASQHNGIGKSDAKDALLQCIRSYRKYMDEYSQMRIMDLWHHSLSADMMIGKLDDPAMRARGEKRIAKERGRSIAEEIFPQLARGTGNISYIQDQLPSIFHAEGYTPGEITKIFYDAFELYRKSLPPVYSFLLNRYQLKDAAIKVVGVGSVGTLCWVFLLMTGNGEPLFLQAKEARPSVLEAFAGKSIYANHGERVINGYRLMQPFSDPFLGWTEGKFGRHYFFRQLRDIKISLKVETFGKAEMINFAEWCGQALALSHARSGDAALLSGYMGKSDSFDQAITDFSFAYAEQNEKDYDALMKAIKTGKLEAEFEA